MLEVEVEVEVEVVVCYADEEAPWVEVEVEGLDH